MSKLPFAVHGNVFLDKDGAGLAGRGRIELLEHVAETGSINKAAQMMGMSYRAAWEAIERMDNLSARPLVERAPGGRGGGGTRLTAEGEQLVRMYRHIEEAHRRFLGELRRDLANADRYLDLARRIGFRASARNQLLASACDVDRAHATGLLRLALANGMQLTAALTPEALADLALSEGQTVLALVKATAVSVLPRKRTRAADGPNVLEGVVQQRSDGPARCGFRVAMQEPLTLWGAGPSDSPLQPADRARCVIAPEAILVVLGAD